MGENMANFNLPKEWTLVQPGKKHKIEIKDVSPDGTFKGRIQLSAGGETWVDMTDSFVHGDLVSFKVKWPDGATGIYCGTPDPMGQLAGQTWVWGKHMLQEDWMADKIYK
jgi:hypothetical protein